MSKTASLLKGIEPKLKVNDMVRCPGDAPEVWGKIESISGDSCTVRWSDGLRCPIFLSMLKKI